MVPHLNIGGVDFFGEGGKSGHSSGSVVAERIELETHQRYEDVHMESHGSPSNGNTK